MSVMRIKSEKCCLLGVPTVRSRATANPIFRGSTPGLRQQVLQAWGRQPGMGQPLSSTDLSSEQGSAQPMALPALGLHWHQPSTTPASRPPPGSATREGQSNALGRNTPAVGPGAGRRVSMDGEAC